MATEEIVLAATMAYLLFLTLQLALSPLSFSIKLPKSKRWKNKVNPIYKLERINGYSKYMTVRKYSLGYSKNFESYLSLFVPFYTLTASYGYLVESDYYGEFDKDEILNNFLKTIYPHKTLKQYYEDKKSIRALEYKRDMTIEERKELRLKEINKIFLENYE